MDEADGRPLAETTRAAKQSGLQVVSSAAKKTFASLEDRNYLYLWTGMMGSWMAMPVGLAGVFVAVFVLGVALLYPKYRQIG